MLQVVLFIKASSTGNQLMFATLLTIFSLLLSNYGGLCHTEACSKGALSTMHTTSMVKSCTVQKRKYVVIAAPGMEQMAQKIQEHCPERFVNVLGTKWEKFPDGTDSIEIGGYSPENKISGKNVIFLCNFYDNDVTLSQISVMITLLQSFIESLTIVLPFYPVGTMERVSKDGQVATASTYAQMLSNLPSCGRPTRVMLYDIHTLQNKFYLQNNAFASLHTTMPLLVEILKYTKIDCVSFPDDGAAKRFGEFFDGLGFEIVTCGKTRDGDNRKVIVQDGSPLGKHVIIVDDLVQTGGTLYECGVALKKAGAISVSAYVAHAVFPQDAWERFLCGGDRNCFDIFYVSNSVPSIVQKLPEDDVFRVVDISRAIINDLDRF